MGSALLAMIEQAGELRSAEICSAILCSAELCSACNLEQAQALMRTAGQLNQERRFYPLNGMWTEAALDHIGRKK